MKVNVYLPDELGQRVKSAELNISEICQAALIRELHAKVHDGHLDSDQRRGWKCIYCGSEDRRTLGLEFFWEGPKQADLYRCVPMCELPPA